MPFRQIKSFPSRILRLWICSHFILASSFFLPTTTVLTKSRFSRDKQKEKSRQAKLKVYQETGTWPGLAKRPERSISDDKKAGSAWSAKTDAKLGKSLRAKKKELKRTREKEGVSQEDLDDLEKDYRMLKKIKQKKVRGTNECKILLGLGYVRFWLLWVSVCR